MRKNNTAASREAMVEDRRARVASFKVQGLSIRQTILALAKVKCVNPDSGKPWGVAAIQSDIEHLTTRWKAEALRDITEAKANELAKLDELEREAWSAWRRGIGRKQIRTTKQKTGGKDGNAEEVALRTEILNGDPRYLETIRNCCADRRKILGLDAPAKIAPTTPDGQSLPGCGVLLVPSPINPEDWDQVARSTQAKLKGEG